MRQTLFLLCAVYLLVGCGKRTQPKPDGSSGIRGFCLLPAGKAGGERKRWPNVSICATGVNSDSPSRGLLTRANQNGEFQLALNPGQYAIEVSDHGVLKEDTHTA